METTPVPLQEIARTIAPFEAARTLPAAAYLSPELFSWENEHFFQDSWVCVGRAAELEAPGSQRAVKIGCLGILLVRKPGGKMAAFHNTCRHRGHELLECGASAKAGVIQCPYHRWTYELDGTFKGGPGLASQPHFDASDPENSLMEVAATEWSGWIFVNISGDAPALDLHLGNLSEILGHYTPESLVSARSHSYVVAANWKVLVENYQECYHCSEIHPELCLVSSPTSGRRIEPTGLWVGGTMELREGAETMSLDGRSLGARIQGIDDAAARFVGYFWLFPNLLISTHPDYVMTHLLQPTAPDETRIECEWLFPRSATERPGFDPSYALDFWDLTNRQDWGACESVQRGLRGPGYRQAPYSEQEIQVYESDLLIARGYMSGSVREPVSDVVDLRA